MGQLIIKGNKRLSGEITVGGSKNAALPIIFSCIIMRGRSRIDNLPDITDVEVALRILECFGARVTRLGSSALIDTDDLYYTDPPEELVSEIRASSYLIGACLSRFRRARLQSFGGCKFDQRPIDMHINAAMTHGAALIGDALYSDKLVGSVVCFDKISVGATVNAILLAASAQGESRIYGFAREPHIMALIDFLRSAGAEIAVNDEYVSVVGRELYSGYADVIPDMIEAGTYLALSVATGSDLKVIGADLVALKSFADTLLPSGISFESCDDRTVAVGTPSKPIFVTALPYPEFPTDLQPITAPLMALGYGGVIRDLVWKNRFGYLTELSRLGVEYELYDGYAKIKGSRIHSAEATALDLRGGASLIIAALAAEGESVINSSELIRRGYGDIVNKLRLVGADISEI